MLLTGCGRLAFDPLTGTDASIPRSCSSVTSTTPVRLSDVTLDEEIAAVATTDGIVIGWGMSNEVFTGEVASTGGALRAESPLGNGYNIALATSPDGLATTYQAFSVEPSATEFRPLTLVGEPATGFTTEFSDNAEPFGNDIVWDGSAWRAVHVRNSMVFGAFATQIANDGMVLQGDARVSNMGDCLCEPKLAWNGTRTAVIFANDGLGRGGYEIGFNTFDTSGVVLYPEALAITTDGGTDPVIGATPDGFVIGYSSALGTGDITWTDSVGAIVDGPRTIHPAARIRSVSSTAAGTFVVYRDLTSFTTTTFSIGWLDRSGAFTRGPFVVSTEPDIERKTVAIPRDDGAVVFYTSSSDGTDALWTRTFTCVD